jgi:hypothetical protein
VRRLLLPEAARPFLNRKDGKDGKRTWEIHLFAISPDFLFKNKVRENSDTISLRDLRVLGVSRRLET